MEKQIIKVDPTEIIVDETFQIRAEMNDKHIAECAEAFERGVDFEPVDLFDTGGSLTLVNGFHRYHAARRADVKTIPAIVHRGTPDDAKWFAICADNIVGLKRNSHDKRRAIREALQHPKASNLSDRNLADLIGVSHPTVASVRSELESTGKIFQLEKRVGADGRTRRNKARVSEKTTPIEKIDKPVEGSLLTSPETPEDGSWVDAMLAEVKSLDDAGELQKAAEEGQLGPFSIGVAAGIANLTERKVAIEKLSNIDTSVIEAIAPVVVMVPLEKRMRFVEELLGDTDENPTKQDARSLLRTWIAEGELPEPEGGELDEVDDAPVDVENESDQGAEPKPLEDREIDTIVKQIRDMIHRADEDQAQAIRSTLESLANEIVIDGHLVPKE
jgi:ParB-like chromosome segregation protein Spo0J